MFIDDSLVQFNKLSKGDEILVPLSNGIFAKAKLNDNSKLIVNVGANVTVEQGIGETRNMLSVHLKDLTELRDKLATQIVQIQEKAKQIEEEMVVLSKKIKEGK